MICNASHWPLVAGYFLTAVLGSFVSYPMLHLEVQFEALKIEEPCLGIAGNQFFNPVNLRIDGRTVTDGECQVDEFVMD